MLHMIAIMQLAISVHMMVRISILVWNLHKYILSARGTRVYHQSVIDIDHNIIIRRLPDSIFNTLPVYKFWWEVQTCLCKTFLLQGCLHKAWHTLLHTADRLYQLSSIWKLLIPLLRIYDSYSLGPVRNKRNICLQLAGVHTQWNWVKWDIPEERVWEIQMANNPENKMDQ
jgi:hypothetical protein